MGFKLSGSIGVFSKEGARAYTDLGIVQRSATEEEEFAAAALFMLRDAAREFQEIMSESLQLMRDVRSGNRQLVKKDQERLRNLPAILDIIQRDLAKAQANVIRIRETIPGAERRLDAFLPNK